MTAESPRSTVVVSGVEPVSGIGMSGLIQRVDSGLAKQYAILLIIVLALIGVAGVSGNQSIGDTLVFALLAVVVAAVIMVLPLLIRRLGVQPEGEIRRELRQSDLASLAVSAERIVVARSRRSGMDVDDQLRPQIRGDLAAVLLVRHRLTLDDERHRDRIIELIGDAAWQLIRADREPRPVWDAMGRNEFDAVLQGCMRAIEPDRPDRDEADGHR